MAGRGIGGTGVEPDPEMAAVARRNLAPFPTWDVAVADFEDYAEERDFALLTCAQAWHWVDPARRFPMARRRLQMGGWLALFWNRPAPDDSALRHDVDAVYAEMAPALSPHGPLTAGQPPAGPPEAGFGQPAWQIYPWVERYSTAQWTDLVQTLSDHRQLAPVARRALLTRLAGVIDRHGGYYDHPYDCWLWTAQRAT
jgi:SAM-dependent methyltransferase